MSYPFEPLEEPKYLEIIEIEGFNAGLSFVSNNETLIDNPYTIPKFSREERDAWFRGHSKGRNSFYLEIRF